MISKTFSTGTLPGIQLTLRGVCQLCKYQIEISYRADFSREPFLHYSEHFVVSKFKPHDLRFSGKYIFSGRKSTQKSLRSIFDYKVCTDLTHNTLFSYIVVYHLPQREFDRSQTVGGDRNLASKSRFHAK